MLTFKKIELADKTLLEPKLSALNCKLMNYSFNVQFLYRDIIDFKFATYKNFIISKVTINQEELFMFPVGEGDLNECLNMIKEYAFSKGDTIRFFQFCEKNGVLLNMWGEWLETTGDFWLHYMPAREQFEYVYFSEKLIKLEGQILKPKRNQINFFTKTFSWETQMINKENIDEVRKFSYLWDEEKDIAASSRLLLENIALEEAFTHFFDIQLQGLLISVENKIVAFSIGCPLNDDTYLILFEKADRHYKGAYSMINREFAKIIAPKFQYINRAEDGNIEGLRKAKLSYQPAVLNEVYFFTIKGYLKNTKAESII